MENHKLLIGLMLLLILPLVSALNQNQFTNGLSKENISFSNNTVERFIQLPMYVNASNASVLLNLNGTLISFGFNETADSYGIDANTLSCLFIPTDLYKFNDSDYSTYIGSTFCGFIGYEYMNYTKKVNATGAIWRIKHGGKPGYNIRDYSIQLPKECFDYDLNKLILKIFVGNYDSGAYCYDGSWREVDLYDSSDTNYGLFYEESINWTVFKSINVSLDVGENDSVYESNYVGLSNTTNINLDFTPKLNTLGGCTCTNCSISGAYCNYPIYLYYNNTGILEVSPNVTYNSYMVVTYYDQATGAKITGKTIQATLTGFSSFNLSTTTGNFTAPYNLGGEYYITSSASDYSTSSVYYANSTTFYPQLNIYLLNNTYTSTTSITVYDKSTSIIMEGVAIKVYRAISGSPTIVNSLTTDVTGRVSFYYVPDQSYSFELTKSGYSTKTFTLNPISFAAYDVYLNKTSVNTDNSDNSYLNVDWTKTFTNGIINDFNFTIISSYGQLQDYSVNISYKTISNYTSGVNAFGGVMNLKLNITGATVSDKVMVKYTYTKSGLEQKSFTYYYDINIVQNTTGTLIGDIGQTYGLTLFERGLIVVIIALVCAGVVAYVSNPVSGIVMGLIVFAFFLLKQFIPIEAVVISIVVLFIFLIWRMRA